MRSLRLRLSEGRVPGGGCARVGPVLSTLQEAKVKIITLGNGFSFSGIPENSKRSAFDLENYALKTMLSTSD